MYNYEDSVSGEWQDSRHSRPSLSSPHMSGHNVNSILSGGVAGSTTNAEAVLNGLKTDSEDFALSQFSYSSSSSMTSLRQMLSIHPNSDTGSYRTESHSSHRLKSVSADGLSGYGMIFDGKKTMEDVLVNDSLLRQDYLDSKNST